jgi:hypothetical protein
VPCDDVNGQNGEFYDKDIVDLNLSGTIRETHERISWFKQYVLDQEKEYRGRGEAPDYI